jgi:hypothetical protein
MKAGGLRLEKAQRHVRRDSPDARGKVTTVIKM